LKLLCSAAIQRRQNELHSFLTICVARLSFCGANDWSQCPAVESVPGKLSDAWVFRGTRVPVSAVFENLEDGLTINEIVQMFDGLSKDPVVTVLEFAAQSLDAPLLAR